MQTREWRHIQDKSDWGNGPWQDEPDKRQWQDEATGLPCLIVRGPMGALCGYVGVPAEHPWHGKSYSQCVDPARHKAHEGREDGWHYTCTPEGMTDVHGGLTFANACAETEKEHGICHIPDAGEPDDVWWFGFDCSHAFDTAPGHEARGRAMGMGYHIPDAQYRSLDYVIAECTKLAGQLAGIATAT